MTWQVVDPDRHAELEHLWQAAYAHAFSQGMRLKTGIKAQSEYARQPGGHFFIVPFTGNTAGPHAIAKPGPRTTAYECHAPHPPDLAAFRDLDFFITPADLAWTMLHTHEDFALGGPYFIRRDHLVPPTRTHP